MQAVDYDKIFLNGLINLAGCRCCAQTQQQVTPHIYRGNGPLYMIIQTEDIPTSVPRRNLDKTGQQIHINV